MTAILALDLAKSRTGYALWQPGWPQPRHAGWKLGSEYSTDGQVFLKLHTELDALHRVCRFETIYYEQAINPANLGGKTNLRALDLAAGLAAHVLSFAAARRCRAYAINVGTWRKDFVGSDLVKDAQSDARARRKLTGKGSARDKLKALTMARCRQLGLAPRSFDEADAIGLLDFAMDFHEHVTPPWRAGEVLRAPLEVGR